MATTATISPLHLSGNTTDQQNAQLQQFLGEAVEIAFHAAIAQLDRHSAQSVLEMGKSLKSEVAGSLVEIHAVIAGGGLIAAFLAIKMVTKFVGILPLTRAFSFAPREGMYTTLLMSTGLTFGTISALFGLTNHIIDEQQYTILVTAVIGSAVVPTLIAQRWFMPALPAATGGEEGQPRLSAGEAATIPAQGD